MAPRHTARPGMNTDIDLKLEPGLAASVCNGSSRCHCGLILSFQFGLSPTTPEPSCDY